MLDGDNKPYFAQDMKGAAMQTQDIPEWKKATFGGKGGSYGKKTNLSILEQRQSLPIYKLKDQLVKVFCVLSFILHSIPGFFIIWGESERIWVGYYYCVVSPKI